MVRLILGLALASLASAGAAQYPPIKSRVIAVEVTPRVYYVQGKPGIASAETEGFNSNAGFVITGEGVVVVDALGTPALGAALVKAIRAVTAKPIRRVVVTHYHADHFYGLKPLKDAGADVWAHLNALEYLAGGEAERRRAQRALDLFPWVDRRCPSCAPTIGSMRTRASRSAACASMSTPWDPRIHPKT